MTPVKSQLVNAPYIDEFPVVLECRLVKSDDLGLHTMFVAEVLDVKIDRDYLKENGMPDIAKLAPVSFGYGDREYYELGDYAGSANRLWQVGSLNSRFNSTEKELLQRINDYYAKIDCAEPLEQLDEFFYWDKIQINDVESTIHNRRDYARWYDHINKHFFDRKHILEKITFETFSADQYRAEVHYYYRARSRGDRQPVSQLNQVRGIVDVTFIRDSNSGVFKIVHYSVRAN